MYNRSEDSTRIVIGIIGGIIYAVGVGLIIFSFASFFLAPAIGGYKKCSLCYKLNEMEKRFCSNCGHDFNLD